MDQLIKQLKTLSKNSKLAVNILAKLGGSIFYLPEGGEIEPTKSSSTDENLDVSDVETEPNNVQQLQGLFNRGEKNVSASNSSVRSILIKRSVYIFLIILLFYISTFFILYFSA